jgi:N utilization substance protein A
MEEESITALSLIREVDDAIARAMYRLGYRALEEVAEAGADELAAIPGIGSVEAATKLKESAEATMERLRQERIHAAAQKTEPLTDKERLLFVRGVGDRTLQLLEEAGYKSVEDILREDEDKLAIKTGFGIKKGRAIKQGAQYFVENEHKLFEAARAEIKKTAEKPASVAPESPDEGWEEGSTS